MKILPELRSFEPIYIWHVSHLITGPSQSELGLGDTLCCQHRVGKKYRSPLREYVSRSTTYLHNGTNGCGGLRSGIDGAEIDC